MGSSAVRHSVAKNAILEYDHWHCGFAQSETNHAMPGASNHKVPRSQPHSNEAIPVPIRSVRGDHDNTRVWGAGSNELIFTRILRVSTLGQRIRQCRITLLHIRNVSPSW
jgi:hypothetical protein